jgi:hypothetical protein
MKSGGREERHWGKLRESGKLRVESGNKKTAARREELGRCQKGQGLMVIPLYFTLYPLPFTLHPVISCLLPYDIVEGLAESLGGLGVTVAGDDLLASGTPGLEPLAIEQSNL